MAEEVSEKREEGNFYLELKNEFSDLNTFLNLAQDVHDVWHAGVHSAGDDSDVGPQRGGGLLEPGGFNL